MRCGSLCNPRFSTLRVTHISGHAHQYMRNKLGLVESAIAGLFAVPIPHLVTPCTSLPNSVLSPLVRLSSAIERCGHR
jgi:hypothetical protein